MTRESPWDEREAARADALTEYEANLPACGHQPVEVDWAPTRDVCPTCRDLDYQARVWAAEDKHLPAPRAGEPHPLDGVRRFLRPATPEEIRRARSDVRSR